MAVSKRVPASKKITQDCDKVIDELKGMTVRDLINEGRRF
jgi:hypothetical protein